MTEKKEQTIGGSKISITGGAVVTNNEKEINIPPKESGKLRIATEEQVLEGTGYMEIVAEGHDALREGSTILRREIDGKEIKPKGNNKDEVEIEK